MKNKHQRLRAPALLAWIAFGACAESRNEPPTIPPILTPDAGKRDTGVAPRDGSTTITDARMDRMDTELRDVAVDVTPPRDTGPDGPIFPATPVMDGVIQPGEYGDHTAGRNMQVGEGVTTTWFLTWNDEFLYVGVSDANVAEGLVLYIDTAPLAMSNGGTNADGTLAPYNYDGSAPTQPIRADFLLYAKRTYNETRLSNGMNGWGPPNVGSLTVAAAAGGTVREFAIRWTALGGVGRPKAFSFTGYIVAPGGFVYGEMPSENPGGQIGLFATFTHYYKVPDTLPGASFPFAMKLTP